MRAAAFFSLSLRERAGVRERSSSARLRHHGDQGATLSPYPGASRPSAALAASLTPALSRGEKAASGL